MRKILIIAMTLTFASLTALAQRAELPTIATSFDETLVLAPIGQPHVEFMHLDNYTVGDVVVNLELDLENSIVPNGWELDFNDQSLHVSRKTSMMLPLTVTPMSPGEAEIQITVRNGEGEIIDQHSLSVITHIAEYVLYDLVNRSETIDKLDQAMVMINNHTKIDWTNQKAVWKFAEDFEVYVFPIGGEMSGVLSVGVEGVTSPIPYIQHLIEQGKKILITSENDASLAFSSFGTPEARQFFMEDLGLMAGKPQVRYQTIAEVRTPISFPLFGSQNDPLFSSISATVNDPSLTASEVADDSFIEKTDILQLVENSNASPIFYYDNLGEQVGGTRIEIGEARVIYLGFGLEGIHNVDQRAAVLGSMIEWLQYGNRVSSVGEGVNANTTNVRLAPNPANSSSVCSFSIAGAEIRDVNVRVLDLRGIEQVQVFSGQLVPGDYSFAIETAELPIGQYNVVIDVAGKLSSQSLMIVR